jgi:CP family cyanate transporter-like MFS transporter
MLEPSTEAAGRPVRAGRLAGGAVLIGGIILVALNLRPAATALPPILTDLRKGLGQSSVETALLPALPILCFGVFAPLAPALRRRLGEERGLAVVLVGVLAGLALRGLWPAAGLLPGTVLACAAIGIGNVLVPSLMKRRLPRLAGVMSGLYTTTLAIGGGLGTGLTVPVMEASGGSLHAALLVWAFPVVLGLAAWAPQLRFGPPPPAGDTGDRRRGLWRVGLAWQVTLLFGLQSLVFYTVVGWLPTLLRSEGYSPGHAGFIATLISLLGPIGSMGAPLLATRTADQRPTLLAAIALCAIGVGGFLVSPTGAIGLVAAAASGIGIGAIFALAVLLVLLRSADSHTSSLLSSMAQTVGYILAAAGPFAFGLLYEATGGWTVPLLMTLALIAVEVPLALGAGRDRQARA